MRNFSSLARRLLAALGLLLATAGAALAQTPVATFAPVVAFGTGTNSYPYSIAVGDVNGDGKPDLLTANYDSNTVGVLLGNGNGTFQPAATFGTGADSQPIGIVVADVNGDNKPDLLTVNTNTDMAGVLLGNGNGTFQPIATFSTGNGSIPNNLAVGDVNGDGKLDLLTANTGTNTAGVLLGNGNGTFQPAVTFGTGTNSQPVNIALGDVNGDSRPDLLTANNGSHTAGVLLGNGNGTFQPVATFSTGSRSYPVSIAVTDVNGDGKPDLLTANTGTNTAGVLLGKGNGIFATVATYGTGSGSFPNSIVVADVNGDGKPDLLTANAYTNTVGLLLGNGNATFQPVATFSTGSGNTVNNVAMGDVAVGDVNGDGKPDLLTANGYPNAAGVLLNTTVYAIPTFTGLSSTSGPIGTSVTLTGTNLSSATGVHFNGTAATFAVVNATTVTAIVPTGATSGNIIVTTPGGSSNGLTFMVTTTAGPLATAPDLSATEVRAFPNPAHENFTVVVPAVAAAGRVQAELCNTLGQVVRLQSAALPAAGARLTVPTIGLAAGVYVLRLQAGSTTLTQRVVVQ